MRTWVALNEDTGDEVLFSSHSNAGMFAEEQRRNGYKITVTTHPKSYHKVVW